MEKAIIERYFKDECTPREREIVEKWLSAKSGAELEHAYQDLSLMWEQWDDFNCPGQLEQQLGDDPRGASTVAQNEAPAFEKVWEKMMRDSGQFERESISSKAYPSEKGSVLEQPFLGGNWRALVRYGAAACLGFFLALVGLWFLDKFSEGDGLKGYVTVETSKGERKWVTLSDGSKVFLNAETRLRYPSSSNPHKSAIYIEGEAFFNMTESETPCIIKAGDFETWVGEHSQLNITAFPSESTVTVAVNQGQAELRNSSGPMLKLRVPTPNKEPKIGDSILPLIKLRPALVMRKHELAVVDKQRGDVRLLDSLNEAKTFGWKDGILYFESANTPELISKLERWYGVTVDICHDGLPDAKYSGIFSNEDISQVLAQMSKTVPFQYQVIGRTVYLCGKQ